MDHVCVLTREEKRSPICTARRPAKAPQLKHGGRSADSQITMDDVTGQKLVLWLLSIYYHFRRLSMQTVMQMMISQSACEDEGADAS
jgi:hypothetical protein